MLERRKGASSARDHPPALFARAIFEGQPKARCGCLTMPLEHAQFKRRCRAAVPR
jgi:hypothetical protein